MQVRQVVPGHWEWRVVHPNGDVAKSSTELYPSESEAREAAQDSLSRLSHNSGWKD